MNQTPGNTTPRDISFNKYIPKITVGCCLAAAILFIGINMEERPLNWDIYKKWGAPVAYDIFDGSYWGIITSNFLHTEIWHIAFNLFWIWFLGKKIEFESNKVFYLLLVLSSAIVSSLAELSFSDTTGIGLSGIVYAFFGYMLVKSRTTEAYRNYIDKHTTLFFIAWLFICIVLTKMNILNVANAAHFGGFAWGLLLGWLSGFAPYKQWSVACAFFATLVSAVFWSPFSTAWLSYRAYQLHEADKLEEAVVIYDKILKRDPSSEFAKRNLSQIDIQKLEKKAYKLHEEQRMEEAVAAYKEILQKDSTNEFAKNNMQQIEVYNLELKAYQLFYSDKKEEALAIYRQILAIDSNHKVAKGMLEGYPLY